MGVYIRSRRLSPDPKISREIIDYIVDEVTDVSALPGNDKIAEASIAVAITGEIYVLTINGWAEVDI